MATPGTNDSISAAAGATFPAVGFLMLLLVVLTSDHRGLPFLVALVLILVSAWAARALQRDPRTLGASALAGTPPPRQSHPVLVLTGTLDGSRA
jgi:membrane protein required for beta-lactamase induction